MVGEPEQRIGDLLRDAGARGWVHAAPLRAAPTRPGLAVRHEVSYAADDLVPMASLYKVLLALAWARLVDAGDLDPRARHTVSAPDRTPGSTGLSSLEDEVVVSQRDLVTLMLTVSDNAAADVLLDLVGLPRLREVAADAGMTATTLHGGTRHHQRLLLEEVGAPGFPEALRLLRDRPGHGATAVYDPAMSSTTTARDMTRLLGALWREELVAPESGARIRRSMARQVFRHRLASGFPHDDVEIASRTGSLLALRHEVGVVTFPGEEPVVVAVLTQALNPAQHLPDVDRAIGEIGRVAVGPLRRVCGRGYSRGD